MQYAVIGDEETVLGFSLAGVQGNVSHSREETEKFLNEYISNADIGIIIITEALANYVKEFIEKYTYKETFPLIVTIPDRKGYREEKISIEEIIRKSVGIKI